MIISFISVKGGVGKTTLALETASSLANDFGKKVLVIDANFSAPNLALHFGVKHDRSIQEVLSGEVSAKNAIYEIHGFDFIPASFSYKEEDASNLKNVLAKIKSKYDFIILDSSPNYRDMIPVISAADKLFVITTPDHVTLHTSMRAANLAKAKKTPVEGIIINKIKHPKYEMNLADVEEFLSVPVVARIMDNRGMVESMFYRRPMTIHDRSNPVSKEIRRFASALAGEPEKVNWFMRSFGHVFKKEKINRDVLRQKLYEQQIVV